MLAVGIKNVILFLLIILILHFLLKNTLVDRKPVTLSLDNLRFAITQNVSSNKSETESFQAPVSSELPKPSDKPAEKLMASPVETVATTASTACASLKVPERNTECEKAELLKYVFGDDKTYTSDEIDKYFKGIEVEASAEKSACLPKKADSQSLPLTTTCEPTMLNLTMKAEREMNISKNCDIKQDKPIMVLKEYENENEMNGGLFGGLNAFDSFASQFEEYV